MPYDKCEGSDVEVVRVPISGVTATEIASSVRDLIASES